MKHCKITITRHTATAAMLWVRTVTQQTGFGSFHNAKTSSIPFIIGGAPQLQEVTETDGVYKGENRRPVIGGADGDEDARQRFQDGQGLVHRRPHKRQHSSQEYGKNNPIQDNPQLAGVLEQRDAQEAHDAVNG